MPHDPKQKRRGRTSTGKTAVKIRLYRDVLDALKAKGDGWQTEANSILRKGLRFSGGTRIISGVQNSARVFAEPKLDFPLKGHRSH
ncbi:BrnA antitoxin family protein [Ensifer adhaerens]|uniref:BrnA antitoxin family protein n=1 Tax=Ensifer adhaerens TaxID=106592 RepID=UPI0009EAB455